MSSLALALVMLGGALLVACGGDDDEANDDDNATEPSTTLSPEDEVEAAYLAFADMGARLLENPDPDDPEIPQRASGEARADLVDGLATLRAAGEHYELGPDYSQEVLAVAVEGTTATADVCVVEDSSRVETSSGRVLASGVTTVDWTVTMMLASDVWQVAGIIEGEVREGAVPCT